MAELFKWPRTYHLTDPRSLSLQNDDRALPDTSGFHNPDGSPRRVVVTEKLDGEGTTMTRALTYPRSPDGRYHPSRDMMKAYHARRAAMIPDDWRVSGEYMAAVHAIEYAPANGNALASWFYGFGIWDETNTLLGWDETLEYFQMLDVLPVPVLYDGPYDVAVLRHIADGIDQERQEGFVVRTADPISYPNGPGDRGRFWGGAGDGVIAKWVRAKHVAANTQHWASGAWRPNTLVEGATGL